jgi:hypothetical protein
LHKFSSAFSSGGKELKSQADEESAGGMMPLSMHRMPRQVFFF